MATSKVATNIRCMLPLPPSKDVRADDISKIIKLAPAPALKPHAILASEPFIRWDRTLWPGRLVDAYLRKAGIRPRELYEIDGVEPIAAMVDRGLGVSLLPDWRSPWPESPTLVRLPVPYGRSYARRIGLIWPRASLRLRLVQAFLDQAIAACAQSSSPKTLRSKRRTR